MAPIKKLPSALFPNFLGETVRKILTYVTLVPVPPGTDVMLLKIFSPIKIAKVLQ
jgi:hypothetical protein